MLSPKAFANSPTSDAFEAMAAGDYHRALGLLHNVDSPGCALMRARAWTRLGRYDRVITECAAREMSGFDAHEKVQLHQLLAVAHLEEGDPARADEISERAMRIAEASATPLLIAFAWYAKAVVAFGANDFERSAQALWSARKKLTALSYQSPRKPHHIDPIVLRARLHDLEAWHHGRVGDVIGQETSCIEAALCAADPRSNDRMIEAATLNNLASRIVTLPSPKGHAYLLERCLTFPWSPHTDIAETRIRSALQNSGRLYGFGQSSNIGGRSAPTIALRLVDCVMKLLYDRWPERDAFVGECRFGVTLAMDLNNADASSTEPFDILELACVIAPFDRALAHRARDIFLARRDQVARLQAFVHLPIVRAKTLFYEGCIAKADGDLAAALAHFDASLAVAPAPAGSPLAPMRGLERFSITRLDTDLEPARAFVAAFPQSPFSFRLREALAAAQRRRPAEFPYLGRYETSAPPSVTPSAPRTQRPSAPMLRSLASG